ncbi:hypothetical protein [Anaerocolumna cellulosilytica]
MLYFSIIFCAKIPVSLLPSSKIRKRAFLGRGLPAV